MNGINHDAVDSEDISAGAKISAGEEPESHGLSSKEPYLAHEPQALDP